MLSKNLQNWMLEQNNWNRMHYYIHNMKKYCNVKNKHNMKYLKTQEIN